MSSSVTGINSLATLFLAPNSQVTHHERRISQIEQLNQMPLYPTEKIIWDENIVPTEYYSGEGVCVNGNSSPCLRDLMCMRTLKAGSVLSYSRSSGPEATVYDSRLISERAPTVTLRLLTVGASFVKLTFFHKLQCKSSPSVIYCSAFFSVFSGCLALAKLNLQFLTLHDYLLRNFNLFRLESTYEIRQDIEDVIFRMKPW